MNEPSDRIDPKLLLAVAFLAGVAVFLLTKAAKLEIWPSTTPIANTVLWTIATVLPLCILLGATAGNFSRLLRSALIFTGLTAILAAYTGYLQTPQDMVNSEFILFCFVASGFVLCFQALIYLQLWSDSQPLTYDRVFLLSWRNLLVALASYLFMAAMLGILWLWGALFKLVEIDFFSELFAKGWLFIPALSVSAGLGFVIFRRLSVIIDTFSKVLRALCFFLLPLVSAILLMFLAVLPFTGLGNLWETGNGTEIVLSLLVICLMFFNAIYRVGEGFTGYPAWLEKLVLLGLATTPAYALIALYGIWLRVDQYGLTVDRCWALTISLLLFGLTTLYAVLVVSTRLNMPSAIGVTNIRFGWVVMGVMVLVNTPVLDFRQISLDNQLAAWERGDVSDEDLDVEYIARYLGRSGYLTLESLKDRGSNELAARIEEALTHQSSDREPTPLRELTPDDLVVWHTDDPVPEALVQEIIKENGKTTIARLHLVPIELDGHAPMEWVAFHEGVHWHEVTPWYRDGGDWKMTTVHQDFLLDADWEALLQDPTNIEAVPSRWKNIRVGEHLLIITEGIDK